jgi:IS1 family transposase
MTLWLQNFKLTQWCDAIAEYSMWCPRYIPQTQLRDTIADVMSEEYSSDAIAWHNCWIRHVMSEEYSSYAIAWRNCRIRHVMSEEYSSYAIAWRNCRIRHVMSEEYSSDAIAWGRFHLRKFPHAIVLIVNISFPRTSHQPIASFLVFIAQLVRDRNMQFWRLTWNKYLVGLLHRSFFFCLAQLRPIHEVRVRRQRT